MEIINVQGYTIEKTGKNTFCIYRPNGFNINHGIFYYTPENIKKFHLDNLKVLRKYGFPLTSVQLIGMDSEITNKRVYTRIINARIRREL